MHHSFIVSRKKSFISLQQKNIIEDLCSYTKKQTFSPTSARRQYGTLSDFNNCILRTCRARQAILFSWQILRSNVSVHLQRNGTYRTLTAGVTNMQRTLLLDKTVLIKALNPINSNYGRLHNVPAKRWVFHFCEYCSAYSKCNVHLQASPRARAIYCGVDAYLVISVLTYVLTTEISRNAFRLPATTKSVWCFILRTVSGHASLCVLSILLQFRNILYNAL